MEHTTDAVTRLTDAQCWKHLRSQSLGRLVTHVGEVLDVFPVNYVVDADEIVFRTAAGSKLVELTVNDAVLFEVDAATAEAAWSVVLRGRARRLETADEVRAADALPLEPWIPTLKYTYVRVAADSVSGRWFARTGEPDRYGIQEY